MNGITGIQLPDPIDWKNVETEALNHINLLDDLFSTKVTLPSGTYTYNDLYSLAMLEVLFETKINQRKDIAGYLIEHYAPVINENPSTIKDFFTAWLTFTPPPAPVNAPEKITPKTGGPGFYIECWDYLVNTMTGMILSNADKFRPWFSQFLNYHGKWINSKGSTGTLTDWVNYKGTPEHPFNINDYQQPDSGSPTGGFKSFNQFFLRNLKKDERPLCNNESSIVAPCDGGIFYLYRELATLGNKEELAKQTFNLPGKSNDPFNLIDAIPGYGQHFVGGPLLDILLWFTDYHHFHAPVTGNVVFHGLYPGSYNYDFDNFDPEDIFAPLAPNDSDRAGWYQKLAKHQRYVWVIETEEFGYVAMIAIGFWGVGSIINGVKKDKDNEYSRDDFKLEIPITKGEYMGHFGYGGSSIVLAFEPGLGLDFSVVDAGKSTPVSDPDNPVLMKVRECLGSRK